MAYHPLFVALLGVDACPSGWIGVVLDDGASLPTAVFGKTIEALVAAVGSKIDIVAIDIPSDCPRAGPALQTSLHEQLSAPDGRRCS